MFDQLEVMQMAHAKARHAAARQSVIAQNVANADTPGYRARDIVDFASHFERLGTEMGRIDARAPGSWMRGVGSGDGPPSPRIVDASGDRQPNGNTVSLETEMTRAIETRHQHDMALSIYRSLSGILRASLGR